MLLVVWMTARSFAGHGHCRIKPRGGSTPPPFPAPFPAQEVPHPTARFIFAASVSTASPLIYLYLQINISYFSCAVKASLQQGSYLGFWHPAAMGGTSATSIVQETTWSWSPTVDKVLTLLRSMVLKLP